jgi:hypothetical protein
MLVTDRCCEPVETASLTQSSPESSGSFILLSVLFGFRLHRLLVTPWAVVGTDTRVGFTCTV